MRLLALETATVEVGAAIAVDGEVRAAVAVRPGRRHAETLHPAIAAALQLAGVGIDELDAVAVDVGPGLFTGLRVGIAAAKTFAFARAVPLVACTSTDVLHHATRHVGGSVAAVVDMRRGELAVALRRPGAPPGALRLCTPDELAAELAALDGPVVAVGDGARRHAARLAAARATTGRPPLAVGGDELAAPPVASLALLAAARLAGHASAGADPVAVEPVYLRPVDARINWTTRDAPAGAAARGGG